MKYTLIAAVVSLIFGQQSQAADSNGVYMVVGDGRVSCEVWSARRGNDGVESANLEQWVFGYLTSLNRWVPGIVNIARGSNHEGLALWVDHYCSENPEKDLADAAEFLFLALRKNQERSND